MSEQFVELVDRGVTLCVDRGGAGHGGAGQGGAGQGGAGRPLLVINGTGSDLRNQPNALHWPIAEHFDVITYDHRCLGRSEQHDSSYQPTMADFALDALALMDQQGIDEFAVIGISFGGMVAQELATIAGSRLTRLVLCCTSSGGEGGASYPLHELYAPGRSITEAAGLYDIRSSYDDDVAAQMKRFFESRPRPTEPPDGLLKQVEARRTHDTWDRLQLISCETLVAYGMYDGIAAPENSERLAERIPHAERASFTGGHMFLLQDERAWPAIVNFLQR